MSNLPVSEDKIVAPAQRSGRRLAPIVVLVVAAVLAGLFVVLINADAEDSETAGSPLLGNPAPAVVGQTLDGQRFDLQRRKGSWVVLNFFNTTCAPCKTEHPELVEFAAAQQSLGANAAELYTVMWGIDKEAAVREFFAQNGGDWPVVNDVNGDIAVAFAVAKVPETWIIDPEGYVRWRVVSNTTAETISELIAQAAAS